MKKFGLHTAFYFLGLFILPSLLNGQVFEMTDGLIETCTGVFTDSGGLDFDYQPNENMTATFCSSGITTDGTHIQMYFSGVDLGAGESLCFFDGTTANPDSLLTCAANFLGEGVTEFVVQATAANTSGCLTIQFTSDGSDEGSGWTAAINCTTACQIFQAIVTSPSHEIIPIDTGYIDICQGERVSFSATGIYGQNNIVYEQSDLTSTFHWTFDDGGTAVGPVVTHTFPNPYGHVVSVVMEDERGCKNSNFVNQRVRVSPTPDFLLGEEIDSLICHGDTIKLTGNVNENTGTDVTILPGQGEFLERGIVSDSIPLPDGDGTCYETPITFETFSPGQVLESVDDLESICVTMEHSWMRDLEISIICPDGTEVLLHDHIGQIGGHVDLGEPVTGDNTVIPGLGYTYCWTNDAPLTWLETVPLDNPDNINPLPAGDYASEEPLSNLVGCELNGEWILKICDFWSGDNGYVFSWNINFNPEIYPDKETYTPAFVQHQWVNNQAIDFYSQDSITAIPQNAGVASFTYAVVDEFGCEYETDIDVEVLPETHPDCHNCNEYISEPEDATICSGETAFLDISANFDPMDVVTFEVQPGLSFGAETNSPSNPLLSGILVNSVAPMTMSDPFGMIESVCIDIEGIFVGDLNIFLIAPSGERLELSTGNGGSGANYTNTCFSPISFQSITTGSAPFTGSYQPEGNWGDLFNADVPGLWQLEISDQFGVLEYSTLNSWSITFNSTNEVTYSWAPDNGSLSCLDCPDPYAIPLDTTDYISTTMDQYGCVFMDTVTVFVVDSIPAPELVCQSIGDGQIQFSWPVVEGINNYDINVYESGVQQGWQMIGNNNEYTFSGLGFEDSVELAVRVHTDGFSDNCGVLADSLTCIYTECGEMDVLVIDSLRVNPVTCKGTSTGEAEVFLQNGHAPITYQWSDEQQQVEQGAYFLPAGHYEVTITDSIYCSIVVPVDIEEPEALTSTIQGTDVLCKGESTGTGTVSPIGGTAPYTFAWDDGTNLDVTSTLDAGMHFVTITDSNDCTYADTLYINEPIDALSADFEQTLAGCNGMSGNSAMVTPIGGTGTNYQFQWSDGQTGSEAENLPAGTVQVIITDEHECQFPLDVALVDLDTLYAAFLIVEPSCHESNDGILSANVYGGGAGQDGVESDYHFEWSSGHQGVAAVNVTGGQEYYLTLTDNQGCSTVVGRYLDEPAAITFDLDMVEPSCQSKNDGQGIVSNVAGVQGDYSIHWDDAGNQSDLIAINLHAGVYSVLIEDSKQCTASQEIEITEPPKLRVEYNTKDNACFGDALGSIDIAVSGGRPGYTYTWSNNGQGTQQDLLPAGIYHLSVTDKNGCEAVEDIEIQQPDPILVNFETEDVSCFGKVDGRINATPIGGIPPFSYSLNNVDFIGSNTLIGLEAGKYNIFVNDAGGCQFIGEATVNEPDEFIVDAGANQTIQLGDTIVISPQANNSQGQVNFVWYAPYEGISSCSECQTNTFFPQTTAIFELYAIDENGCEDSDLITIFVEKPRLAVVPTGFTPNGDLINDRLLVHGLPGTIVKTFKIFDRWGELVFEANDFEVNDVNVGWDGKTMGKDAASGVYVWQLEVEYPHDQETGQFTGETSLIR